MKTSNGQYAQALHEVAKDLTGADLSTAIENFIRVLAKDHKLRQANGIIIEFEKYAKKQDGVVSIEITSAGKLDDSLVSKIKNVFGDKVNAVERLEKSLIGGVRIKTDDKILDGSVRAQLEKMKLLFV